MIHAGVRRGVSGGVGAGGRDREERRTEYFPAFAEPFTVLRVDDIDNGVAVIIVSVPDRANAPLATEIPEFEDGGWKTYLPH